MEKNSPSPKSKGPITQFGQFTPMRVENQCPSCHRVCLLGEIPAASRRRRFPEAILRQWLHFKLVRMLAARRRAVSLGSTPALDRRRSSH